MKRARLLLPPRLVTRVVAVAILLVTAMAGTFASPAAAQNPDDFVVDGDLTASLDIRSGGYDLALSMTFNNNSPDFLVNGWGAVLSNTYTDMNVTVEGQRVPHEREREDDDSDLISFEFPRQVQPGGSITYTIRARQPAGNLNISNAAYFYTSFVWNSDLAMPLTVQFPRGFDVEAIEFGTNMNKSERNGRPTFTTQLPADRLFFGFFEGMRDAELVRRNVEVGGVTAEVAGWPGQRKWMNQTTSVIEDSLNVLQDVSGRSLPDAELSIVRRNISGVEVKRNGNIELGGDELDPRLLIDRFAPRMFRGEHETPWINAGLAATYSELAIAEVNGGAAETPSPPGGGAPLNEWAPDGGLAAPESPADEYAWDASWLVVNSLYDELGADGLGDVLAAAQAGDSAYPATGGADGDADDEDDGEDEGDDDTSTTEPEDATEDIAPPVRQDGGDGDGDEGTEDDDAAAAPGDGSGSGAEEWQLVLDHAEAAGATSVADQYREYVVTDEQSGSMDERDEARGQYDELLDRSDGWEAPPLIRDAMAAWDFGTATSNIDLASQILESAGDLDDATSDLGIDAPSIQSDYESATDDLQPVLDATNEALATTDDLLEAQDAADADRGLVERIGLIGTDLDGKLDDAKASFEAGEFDRATEQADDLVSSADDASSTGLLRLLIGLAILVIIAGVIVFLVVRRRRGRSPDGPADGESALAPPPVGAPVSGGDPAPPAPSASPRPPDQGFAPPSEMPPPPPPGSRPPD